MSFSKSNENCKLLSEFFGNKKFQACMTMQAQKFRKCISKMRNKIRGVTTTHFVMPKLFNVHKEKHLLTEHGLDEFFVLLCVFEN